MSTFDVTLPEVIQNAVDDALGDVWTAISARVEAYDGSDLVDVKPMTKLVRRDADGNRLVYTLPVISSVPVAFPRAGGFYLRMPIAVGDSGLIVVTKTDLGAWRDSGQDSDPGDERQHSLAGAVFFPGLEVASRALPAGVNHMVLGKEGGAEVHFKAATIELGAEGGQFVALAPSAQAAFNAIFDALTMSPAGPGYGAAVQAALTVSLPTGVPDVAATKVKAT